MVLSAVRFLAPNPRFPIILSSPPAFPLDISVLNNENCVKNVPSSIEAISLTPKILKSGLCAFCDAAKRLLTKKNIPYKEINVALEENKMEEMIKKLNIYQIGLRNI